MWFDEIFSVHAARQTWPELFRFAAADIIHPPLFYALLKIWIALGGQSLLWLRLLPFIFAIATIFPVYFLCRDLKLRPGAFNIALLLMSVSGFLIKYAQEVRMYSLLLFFSVMSMWLFMRFMKASSPRAHTWIGLLFGNLLLVYTHYYGWLLVLAEVIVLLIWNRKRVAVFLIGVTALVVAYVPWIYAVAVYHEPARALAQNIGWIAKPRATDVLEYFVLLSKPFLFSQSSLDLSEAFVSGTLLLLLAVVAVALLFYRKRRAHESDETITVLLILLIVPVISAIVLSWLLPYAIWGTRHLIVSAVPFFILAGIAIESLRPYAAKLAMLIVFGCVISLAGAIYLLRPAPQLSWCAWDGLIKQIPATAGNSTTVVYSFEDLVAYHAWFAATERATPLQIKVVKLPGVPEDPAFFLPRRFSDVEIVSPTSIQEQHVWIAFRARQWDEKVEPLRSFMALGYTPQTVLSANALGEQAFLVELRRSGNQALNPLSFWERAGVRVRSLAAESSAFFARLGLAR